MTTQSAYQQGKKDRAAGKPNLAKKLFIEGKLQWLYTEGYMAAGEPLFKATVNLLLPPRKGHVWLKGWSENEGIPQALADAGIVELTGTHAQTGHASADEACLLVDIPE